ncbi:MAG: DUF2460 domain-containing protein [Alphaproteobacteria bacterium]|nr:DUF2460 domain-containing protein [Alphaproteobacteria bacterium]
MSFVEIRFPEDIAYGSSGGPSYSTDVVMTNSGHEQRNINWEYARTRYDVAHGVKTQTQLDNLIAFFRARKGRAYGFRFKDWSDYEAIGQILATGDGATQNFQMVKHYISGGVDDVRVITKPVASSVKLYVDSVLQSTGFSVDDTMGDISFSVAPSAGAVISADFEFDVPVRFDTDSLSARLDNFGVYSWGNIPLVELRV